MAGLVGVRGAFLDYLGDPFHDDAAARFTPDGLLVVDESSGTIKAFGPYAEVAPAYDGLNVKRW
jgi:guanine deaminase